jgi:dTDP-4-amino-4,6-dideoxygalactose transaminase
MTSPTDSRQGSPASELAINGGKPVRTEPYPAWPHYGSEEIAAAVAALESGHLSSLSGDRVRGFEAAWAEFQGVEHAVAISSGTGAIHAALIAAQIGPGDDVVVTPHSFIASVTAVLHAGARPVFADIDRRTFNLTAASIERAITPNTKAVVTVHLNGHPADPEATAALCEERGIVLIEDCAQAHGARWDGRLVGTFGSIGTYSFWEDKILTTSGEGGMLVTDDADLARRARMAIHHGEEPTDENYYAGERLYLHQLIGWNYRMTEVQGAIGTVQLSRLEGYLERRRELAALFTEALSGVRGVIPPYVDERATHSFYKYIVQLDRDVLSVPVFDFVEAVRAEGVPATRRYPTSIHEQPIIVEKRGFGRSNFPFGDDYAKPSAMPNAERVARDAIQVTVVNPSVSDQDVRDAATAIAKVAGAFAESEA